MTATRTLEHPEHPEHARSCQILVLRMLAWMYRPTHDLQLQPPQRQAEFARRVTEVLTTLHTQDHRTSGQDVLDHAIHARAEWYTLNPTQRPLHKIPDPANPARIMHIQLPALEQAQMDRYDSNTLAVVGHAARFAFTDNAAAQSVVALDNAYQHLTQNLDPEFSRTNEHIRDETLRALHSMGSRVPDPLDGFCALFSSEYAIATNEHLTHLQHLSIAPGDTGADYISEFRSWLDLVKTNPSIRATPSMLYNWALTAFERKDRDAYNHINTVMLSIHGQNESQHTIENMFPIALNWCNSAARRADMAALSQRTVTFTPKPTTSRLSPARRKTYSPPPPVRRTGTGRGYQQSAFYSGGRGHQQQQNCNFCHTSHEGYSCPLQDPNSHPPGWQIPHPNTPQYHLYQLIRQQQPQMQQHQQPAHAAPSAPKASTDYRQQPPPRSYGKSNPKSSHYSAAAGSSWRRASGDDGLDDVFDASCMADAGESLVTLRPRTATSTAPAPTTAPATTPAPAPAPQPAAAPGIARRPVPTAFAPTPLPRNVPMSQLPTATRAARQRVLNAQQPSHAFTLPPTAQQHVTRSAPACTVSLLELLSLGSGTMAEQVLAQTSSVLVHGISTMPVSIPLESLSVDLSSMPAAARKQFLTAYSQLDTEPTATTIQPTPTVPANPQPSNPTEPVSFTAGDVQAALSRCSTPDDQPWAAAMQVIDDGPDPTMPRLIPLNSSDTDTSLHAATPLPANNTNPPDRPTPSIYTLSPIPAQAATLTHADTGEQLMSADHSIKTVADSASTLNLISLALAKHLDLTWGEGTPMRTSSGDITHTLGRVTSPVAITMCYTDPAASTSVQLDLDVVYSSNFDLLLGVQWMDAFGVDMRTAAPSSLTYYTQFPHTRKRIGPVCIPLVTTRQ
jgi:hypothetical protein